MIASLMNNGMLPEIAQHLNNTEQETTYTTKLTSAPTTNDMCFYQKARPLANNCSQSSGSQQDEATSNDFVSYENTLCSAQLRRRLQILIERNLQNEQSALDRNKLMRMAKCIENLVFLQGNCPEGTEVDASRYEAHLKRRLMSILSILLQRKARNVAHLSPEARRHKMLCNRIGSKEGYERALKLVGEVKQLRLQHASLGCRKCLATGVCPRLTPPDLQGSLPEPVQRLFFHIHLVQAVDNLTASKILQTTKEQWEHWMNSAEHAIRDFCQWQASSSAETIASAPDASTDMI